MEKSILDQSNDPLAFTAGKPAHCLALLRHFLAQYAKLGEYTCILPNP